MFATRKRSTRKGSDSNGNTWSAVRLDAVTLTLTRNGRTWVEACGTRTLATLTTRYAITWE